MNIDYLTDAIVAKL